jgi:hypothetical protein
MFCNPKNFVTVILLGGSVFLSLGGGLGVGELGIEFLYKRNWRRARI